MLLVFVFVKTTKIDFSKLSNFLNIFTIILLLFPIKNIAFNLLYKFNLDETASIEIKNISTEKAKKAKPDIYYIILDAYPREDILKSFYDFDNADFINFLENSGFYIGNQSRSNYPVTAPSLYSTLNMSYVETRNENTQYNKSVKLDLFGGIENNKVIQFLKSQGYKYYHLTSDMRATSKNQNADVHLSAPNWIPRLWVSYAQNTFLKALNLSFFDPIKIRQDTLLYQFDELQRIPHDKSPTFTFAHIMMPHEPIVFDEHGKTPANTNKSIDGYLKFIQFANKKTKTTVEKILSNSETPPVILIQADHGGQYLGECFEPSRTFVKEKMAILNAYYAPKEAQKLLYDTITPVNSFRVLFDYYFGTELGLIEDKVYWTFCYGSVYQPIRVPDEKPVTDLKIQSNQEWINALEEADLNFPNNALIKSTLGKEYFIAKRNEDAEKYLREALKSKYIPDAIYRNLGKALRAQNKNHEAIQAFENSLAENPQLNVMLLLAETYIVEKKFDAAKVYLEKADQSDWITFKHLRSLAKLFSEIGDFEKGISYYKKYSRYYGHYPDVHMKMSEGFDQLKNGKNAIIHTKLSAQLYQRENDQKNSTKMEKRFNQLLLKYNYPKSDFDNVRAVFPNPPAQKRTVMSQFFKYDSE